MNSNMNVRPVHVGRVRGSLARALATLALAGVVAACDDIAGPATLSTLDITPPGATVVVGGTVQFTAVGTREGVEVTNLRGESWSVSGGGTIDSNGLFTAGTTPGTSTITLTCGGLTTTADVVVTGGPVATITVTPNPATVPAGGTQQYTAVGRDAFGNAVPINPTWTVTSGGGTINSATGLFTAGNTAGTFENTVRATDGSLFGTATAIVTAGAIATITVTPNPATLPGGGQEQFTATARDAEGNIVPFNPVWSVVNGGGTVDPNTGLFTAGATAGTYNNTVRASAGPIAGTATVTVTPGSVGPLSSITVTPNPATVPTGEQQQFVAVGRDAAGNRVPINPTWSVTNGGGTINASTGVFTAGGTTGTFTNTVTATDGASSGSATVNVTGQSTGPLATITVTPDPASLAPGAQQQFTAVGRDAEGNVVPINPTWSVTNGGGTINPTTGVFTAGNTTGTFENTVRATDGSIFGTATVIVGSSVESVTITPANPTVCVGEGTQLTAILRDAAGNVLSGYDVVFTSTNTAVAAVTAGGMITALAEGTTTINATAEGRQGSTEVTVVICLAAVASVELDPVEATVAVNAEVQLVATVRDELGNILTGREVTFTSDNTAVATVDATGTVTGVGPGVATITAEVEGHTATSAIVVIP